MEVLRVAQDQTGVELLQSELTLATLTNEKPETLPLRC